MVRKTPENKRRFTGYMDAKKLQAQIDALRERQKEALVPIDDRIKAVLAGKPKPEYPYALAGLAGRKRTKRPKKWTPKPRYVKADSRSHRAKDHRSSVV